MAELYPYKWDVLDTSASTKQTLHELADIVERVYLLAGGATSIALKRYTVVSTTATTTAVAFSGTPGAPSDGVTFSAALTAGGVALVRYVPAGHLPVTAIPPQN